MRLSDAKSKDKYNAKSLPRRKKKKKNINSNKKGLKKTNKKDLSKIVVFSSFLKTLFRNIQKQKQ
jgi:hypothetical protein